MRVGAGESSQRTFTPFIHTSTHTTPGHRGLSFPDVPLAAVVSLACRVYTSTSKRGDGCKTSFVGSGWCGALGRELGSDCKHRRSSSAGRIRGDGNHDHLRGCVPPQHFRSGGTGRHEHGAGADRRAGTAEAELNHQRGAGLAVPRRPHQRDVCCRFPCRCRVNVRWPPARGRLR